MSDTVAVFVDAGYLYRGGAQTLDVLYTGRQNLKLNLDVFLKTISHSAETESRCHRLLRIYWYDGADPRTHKSAEHSQIALSPNVKLRLGRTNASKKQKGVDGLLVSDLIDLARHKAMDAAVIFAGDEDLRPAVMVTQAMGVRVHLIGLSPVVLNQSVLLREEADTTMEWDSFIVRKFLTPVPVEPAKLSLEIPAHLSDTEKQIAQGVTTVLAQAVTEMKRLTLLEHYAKNPPSKLPYELDKMAMFQCKKELKRELKSQEREYMRKVFHSYVTQTPLS